jgi:response regulator NasT
VILLGEGMLLVCGQRDFGEQLLSIITSVIPGPHSTAASGALTRRMTSLTEYEAVLIAGKLPDETATDLAIGLSENGVKGIMIVIDRVNLADAHEVLDGTGVTILAKPLTKDALTQAIKLIVRVGVGNGGIFEKAKLMLVQQKNWTEPQAHRYIQKMSMDKRLPRDVTSQLVIRALERERNSHN